MALQSSFSAYPSGGFFAVTPSDATVLPKEIRGVYVGGAGNVSCENASGVAVVFTAPPVGSILPISPTKIRATGTTATLLVALK